MAPRSSAGSAVALGLIGQAAGLTDPAAVEARSSVVASALDVGRCLGVAGDDSLVMEPCLDGAGKPWTLSVASADKEGVLSLASSPDKCINGDTLTLEKCDGSAAQQGWLWSHSQLTIQRGGKCLSVSLNDRLVMEGCLEVPDPGDNVDWALWDQNGEGAPAEQTWILMPTQRPQIDILDTLNFPLRVSGRYVIDSAGTPVKLVGVNWVGAHLAPMVNFGLNYQKLQTLAKYIKHMGFNHVRLNYALGMLHAPGKSIDPTSFPMPSEAALRILKANPELKSLSYLEIFDQSVKALTDEGLLVILNNHMSDPGWCCSTQDGNGLWFNENYTSSDWLNGLTFMSDRYKANQRVFAHDIRNEPRPDMRGFKGIPGLNLIPAQDSGECEQSAEDKAEFDPRAPTHGLFPLWGLETKALMFLGIEIVDWRRAASQGAVAVWKGNPDTNVIVEGTWYASNLAYVRELPLSLAQDCLRSQMFYSLHEYPWFSLIYGLWEYLVSPFRLNTILQDLKTFLGSEEDGLTCLEKKHPFSEMDYDRFKETRFESGWNLVNDSYAPVWASEFGTGRRAKREWYKNTFKMFGELDADWAWWAVDVDKTPVDYDLSNPAGEMDASGIFNPGMRDYKSVVGWKLQDLISVMAPGPDYPKQVEVPDKCVFDLEANAAVADEPTDNWRWFTTIHWTWYTTFWGLVWLLLLLSPCLCLGGCGCCVAHRIRKRRARAQDVEMEGLLDDEKDVFDGRSARGRGSFLNCCKRC